MEASKERSEKFNIDGEITSVEVFGKRTGYKSFMRRLSLAIWLVGSSIVCAVTLIPYYYEFSNFEYYCYASWILALVVMPLLENRIKARFKPLSYTDEQKFNETPRLPA